MLAGREQYPLNSFNRSQLSACEGQAMSISPNSIAQVSNIRHVIKLPYQLP